jgi:hypothetical protein
MNWCCAVLAVLDAGSDQCAGRKALMSNAVDSLPEAKNEVRVAWRQFPTMYSIAVSFSRDLSSTVKNAPDGCARLVERQY